MSTDPKLIEAVARAYAKIADGAVYDAMPPESREMYAKRVMPIIAAYEAARGDGVVKPDVEIRRNDDGTIDEVVATGVSIHIEQMNTGSWYIGLDGPDDVWQFWLNGKGKVAINGEHSSANRPPEIRRAMIATAKGE